MRTSAARSRGPDHLLDDQQAIRTPTHLRVHDISILAFDRAGDPDWYPGGRRPAPLKLYYSTWSRRRLVAMHEGLLKHSGESPFDEAWFERPDTDHRATTRVDVGDYFWACTGRRGPRHAGRPHGRSGSVSSTTNCAMSTRGGLDPPAPDPFADGGDYEHDLFDGVPTEVAS
ncbi:MAG: hypothetical protein R2697_07665 [Ilumatobacteraceae bacterium]